MESSKFNYNNQPFLVKFGMAISSIGYIWHNGGFKAVMKHIYYNITILVFQFGYKHSKWFRRRIMKKFKVNGAEPFLTFSIIQMLIGNLFNFEKTTSEE